MSKIIELEQNSTEIWPKPNKVCFQKKFEILIILVQNIRNSGVGGRANVGGDGGCGDVSGGGSGNASGGGGDGGVDVGNSGNYGGGCG